MSRYLRRSETFSRRRLLEALPAVPVVAFAPQVSRPPAPKASNAVVPTALPALKRQALMRIDFTSWQAERNGQPSSISSTVGVHNRILSDWSRNHFLGLPFLNASTSENSLPDGLEWHGSAYPKTLVRWGGSYVAFDATAPPGSDRFGGLRTTAALLAPGATMNLRFRCRIDRVSSPAIPSFYVHLIGYDGDESTVEALAKTPQESGEQLVHVELKAPLDARQSYRIVLSMKGQASESAQTVRCTISEPMLTEAHPVENSVGVRGSMPSYTPNEVPYRDVAVRGPFPPGNYAIVVNSEEVGWFSEVYSTSETVERLSLQTALGRNAHLTLRELYIYRYEDWPVGSLAQFPSSNSWIPIRFTNINGKLSDSRVESPNRLSEALGFVAACTSLRSDRYRGLPTYTGPSGDGFCSYNQQQKGYIAFDASRGRYIGDPIDAVANRSEILPLQEVKFERDFWVSLWFRILDPVADQTPYDRKAVLLQLRYMKNLQGDSSALSPDFALEQLPNQLLRIGCRSDGGIPDLAGGEIESRRYSRFSEPRRFEIAQWQSFVACINVSDIGGGGANVWLNGQEWVSGLGPVGYRRSHGPRMHFGAYKYAQSGVKTEVQGLEFGHLDLSHRIDLPRPI